MPTEPGRGHCGTRESPAPALLTGAPPRAGPKPRPKRGGCQAAPAPRSPPRATGGASGNPRPGRPGGRGGSGSERNYLGHGTDVRAAGAGAAAWVLLPPPPRSGPAGGLRPLPAPLLLQLRAGRGGHVRCPRARCYGARRRPEPRRSRWAAPATHDLGTMASKLGKVFRNGNQVG